MEGVYLIHLSKHASYGPKLGALIFKERLRSNTRTFRSILETVRPYVVAHAHVLVRQLLLEARRHVLSQGREAALLQVPGAIGASPPSSVSSASELVCARATRRASTRAVRWQGRHLRRGRVAPVTWHLMSQGCRPRADGRLAILATISCHETPARWRPE